MPRRVTGQVPPSAELAERVRVLLADGLSKRAIAVQLGVSETTVYRCLRNGDPGTGGAVERKRRGAGRRGSEGAKEQRSRGAEGRSAVGEDGYPPALLRRVPRDFTPILPPGHYRALVRAAADNPHPAAVESLRQARLLHAEPMIPPPTGIELVLSEEEEEEWGSRGVKEMK